MTIELLKKKRVFIIAEAGVNHDGDIKKALKLVDVAVKAKVDAIKFQTFLPGELTGKFTLNVNYLKKNKINLFELTKKLALKFDNFIKIKKYCDRKKVLFLSTPDGKESLRFLTKVIKIPIIKIGSSEVTNHEFLKLIAKQNLPIIFSTGMSTLSEVQQSMNIMKKFTKKEIIILHCTTEYPAPYKEMNIRSMTTLEKKFKCRVGLSDHSLGFESSIVAVALGAKVLEKHFTINKNLKGPDHQASLSPIELKEFVKAVRNAEDVLGSAEKKPTFSEIKNIPGVRRGIVAACFIKKGAKIKKTMLLFKRPFKNIHPFDAKKIVGKISKKNFKEDEPISWEHLK